MKMKKLIFTIGILSFISVGNLFSQEFKWANNTDGSLKETPYSICTDNSGNVYIVGEITSSDLNILDPGTGNYFQATKGGGTEDVFIAKYSASGMPIWITYYGGSGNEIETHASIDGNGNLYLTGWTTSSNLPLLTYTVAGAYNQSSRSGASDAFIARFNISGKLEWASYLGGTGTDRGNELALDQNDNLYITGYTGSVDFPTTSGAFQAILSGTSDAFITKFNSYGVMEWSTYYGGDGFEFAKDITVDNNDNVLVTGITTSSGFPVTAGVVQTLFQGGTQDIFIGKFDNSGVHQWATFYGGSSSETSSGITVDDLNNIYVTGYLVASTDFPLVDAGGGAYFQSTYGGGTFDGFIFKLNSSGTASSWSTYYGGTGQDLFFGNVSIDNNANVYMKGLTASTDIITQNPGGGIFYQGANGGSKDVFILKFNTSNILKWGTYLGGLGNDNGQDISTDNAGNVYTTGIFSDNLDFGITNLYSLTTSAFTAKMGLNCSISSSSSITDNLCYGENNGSATIMATGGTGYYAYAWSSEQTTSSINNLAAGTYTVIITDDAGCTFITTAIITEPAPLTLTISGTNATCNGCNDGMAFVFVSGGTNPYSYTWSNGQTTVNVSNLSASTYTACITDSNGCTICKSIQITEPSLGIIADNVYSRLKIYPNPVSEFFDIEIVYDFTSEIFICVTNIIGQKFYMEKDNTIINGVYKKSFDTSNWPAGIYMLNIRTNRQNITEKIEVISGK